MKNQKQSLWREHVMAGIYIKYFKESLEEPIFCLEDKKIAECYGIR